MGRTPCNTGLMWGVGPGGVLVPLAVDADGCICTSLITRDIAADAAAVTITNAPSLIEAAVPARIRLEIHHQGPDSAARVWLGVDNALTAGAAGNNFGYLDPGDTWQTRDYTGAVYGRTEAGTALVSHLEV
jgi:hypothetical protein